MKSILMSIQPYWVFLIIAKTMGWNYPKEKTVEVRKTYPQNKCWNRIVKIYCSKDKKSFNRIPKAYQPLMEKFLGKVVGEFVCNGIDTVMAVDTTYFRYITVNDKQIAFSEFFNKSSLIVDDLGKYLDFNTYGYGWHISDLKIYDKPKELSEFRKPCKCLDGYEGEVYCDCLNCEDAGDSDYGVVACDRTLARPPQSWCYVEEV